MLKKCENLWWFIVLVLQYPVRVYAVSPDVKFQAFTNGCKIWVSKGIGATVPKHSQSENSGEIINKLEWTPNLTSEIDLNQHPCVRVNCLNEFGLLETGIGEASLSLHVQSLQTGEINSFPWACVYPSGGARVSVGLNLESIPAADRDFTFLVYRSPEHPLTGGWIHVENQWVILENKLKMSVSAQSQSESKIPSLIQASAFFDFTNVGPGTEFQSGDQEIRISYRVISPEFCSVEERLANPVSDFASLSAEEILQSVVCLELIPSTRTENRLSWSDRQSQIHPRLRSLQQFRDDSSVLDRFKGVEFKNLITRIVDMKLKRFYQWASHNFQQDLTSQANFNRDLSRILNSSTYPLSYRRMLENCRRFAHDLEFRSSMAQEFLQMRTERSGMSADSRYQLFLNQLEELFHGESLDLESIDALINQSAALSEEYEARATMLQQERDEYELRK